jgi:lipoprotein-anchoring transpeptidase ErfK/SrfK
MKPPRPVSIALLLVPALMLLWPGPAFAHSGPVAESDLPTAVRLASLVAIHAQPDRSESASPGREIDAAVLASEVSSLVSAALGRNPTPPILLRRPYMGLPLSMLDAEGDIEVPEGIDGGKWIDVDLSEQTVIAFEGRHPVRRFIISSGLAGTPTVTGTFEIISKVRTQTMSGGDRAAGNYYSLPNVEWVQYFYQDYSFHGTYWHNNFGVPMSHGCLNMTNDDAKWLFEWADPPWNGKVWQKVVKSDPKTIVVVHD